MHWMHHEAQKFSTVGLPRSDESFSVGEPLKPSNVQSGRGFPGDVKLWGVHAANGESFGLLAHETDTTSSGITMSFGARTHRLCLNRAPFAGRRHWVHAVGTVAAG